MYVRSRWSRYYPYLTHMKWNWTIVSARLETGTPQPECGTFLISDASATLLVTG